MTYFCHLEVVIRAGGRCFLMTVGPSDLRSSRYMYTCESKRGLGPRVMEEKGPQAQNFHRRLIDQPRTRLARRAGSN